MRMSLKRSFVSNAGRARRSKMFPMRDEPEGEAEEGAMLRVNEHHNAEHRGKPFMSSLSGT